MSDTREKTIYRAKLAEQAERYDEMAELMRQVAEMHEELSVEDRNLLSVAYKNAVGARRAAWRIVTSVEGKQTAKGNTPLAALAAEYRSSIEAELNKICEEMLTLLEKHLIKTATSDEAKVFYYKMKGDYHRYISEYAGEVKREEEKELALKAYQDATNVATEKLSTTHPIRLGLALNFSVFYYEIMDKREEACDMAQRAFDTSIAELDNVSEDSYRDATLIMQLLRDNLTLWSSDLNTEAADPAAAAGTKSPPAPGAEGKKQP